MCAASHQKAKMFVPRSIQVASQKKAIMNKLCSSTGKRERNEDCKKEDGKDEEDENSANGKDDATHTKRMHGQTVSNRFEIIYMKEPENGASFESKNMDIAIPAEPGASDVDDASSTIQVSAGQEQLLLHSSVAATPVIKSYCKQQRLAVPGEPQCIVCGRYGEYICDQTEADVCSLECKARNLTRSKKLHAEIEHHSDVGHVDTEEDMEDVGPSRCVAGYTYTEHDNIYTMTNEQAQEIRNQVSIFVEGLNIPKPITEFFHLNLPKIMASNVNDCGYKTPTAVQMQVIPVALRNQDLMVCAQTSSGKTASFLIPVILHIYNEVNEKEQKHKPIAVVLTPTRELAMQIELQAKQIMKGLQHMKTVLLVGGLPLPPQLHRLNQGIQLIIATPGRLLEIIDKQGICLAHIKLLVIDEVDSMLQMGFQDQVLNVVKTLPDHHQTMLFSATIPTSIETLSSSLLHNPVYISIGTPSTPSSSVQHTVLWVEDPSKKKKLFALLQDPKHYRPPLVIFVDSKLGCEILAQTIRKVCGLKVATLHGDKTQVERSSMLKMFLESSFPIMVCTAVLGRGVDLVGVKLVINFDMPNTVEEYIHQIGRTGRLGAHGTAVTFINNGSKHLFLEFVTVLEPLKIQLPPQLCNSPHLHLQREKHEHRKSKKAVFAKKRKYQREGVKDILHKRKWMGKF